MHLLGITPGEGFHPERWAPVVDADLDALMIREKHLEARALLEAAAWVRQRRPDLPLWVNGRLDVALAVGAGLHAPERHPEVPGGLLPRSRPLHAPSQWPARRDLDQLLIAPALPVPGKGPAWGIPALHAFLDGLPPEGPRLLALGGVTEATAGALRHPRLAGAALLRSLWEGAPDRRIAALRAAWG